MLSLSDALFGLGLPALVGIVLFFVGRREFADTGSPYAGRRYTLGGAIVFAVGLGFLLGYCALSKSDWFPVKEPTHWLFLAAVAMMPTAVAHQFLWQFLRADWLFRAAGFVILACAIGGIFSLLAESEWTVTAKIGWGIAVWLAAAAMTVGVEFKLRLAADSSPDDFAAGLSLAIVSGLTAGVIGMSGSQTYGQIAAIVPAALVPVVLLSPMFRTRIVSIDTAPLFVLLVDGMLLFSYLYSDLTALNAALLFLSPIGLWADVLPMIRKRKTWQRCAIQVLAVCLLAALPFGLALAKFVRDMSGEFGA